MSLKEYTRKRKFNSTPEPRGAKRAAKKGETTLLFVVQMHAATRLHFDLRFEMDGVFKSWAIPKGHP
jgi:bifunctional non-homologous end joining protein LigD